TGFIGSHFWPLLRAAGVTPVLLDLHPAPWEVPSDQFIQGDIRDRDTLRRAMEGCDRVLHLAAAHHDFGIERDTYFDVNERGTSLITEVMDEQGVRDICFYSTVAVYGDAPTPHEETTVPVPTTPYGESKLAGERVLDTWTAKGEDRRALVIRPTVTFGIDNYANMYSLIRQVQSGKYIQFGPGANIKSLSYVENIVEATMYLWERDWTGFDVFNYIDKPDLTSRQIAATVYESLGKKAPKATFPLWLGRLACIPFDLVIALTGKNLPVSSARLIKLTQTETKFEADKIQATGYEYRVPLREGIDRMVKWYLETGQHREAHWRQPPADVQVFETA
ncbi:MAG: NAD(P)-dependent oxidoreductase, partial [Phycisphaerales bacterium]|nr:NAD(P)-dependent oxidoreductase [Phycisphaerales bacterium]